MKQDQWINLLLVAVIVVTFLVLVLSLLLEDGHEEALTEEEHAAEGLILAINTNKSIFLPGEDAGISIAVLDALGEMVCDAELMLTITEPDGQQVILGTDEGTISATEDCMVYGATSKPDYYARYRVKVAGNYVLRLEAKSAYAAAEIEDSFLVKDYVEFSVTRYGPTRIYPAISHNMKLLVKANTGYKGPIMERVPLGFEISPRKGLNVTAEGSEKILTWEVELKAGRRYVFSYEFKAPGTSPAFYELGPLKIENWTEARRWQIASDVNYINASGEKEAILLMVQGCNLEASTTTAGSFTSACAGTYTEGTTCAAGNRLSCNDGTSESSTFSNNNKWVGVNMTAYNSTVFDCGSITSVRVCHRFYLSSAKVMSNCRIGIDNIGLLTYTYTEVACPDVGMPLACTDVTAQAQWTCANFFTSSAGAWAMIEAQRVATGGPVDGLIDALYFNVTYTPNVPPNNTIIYPVANANFSGSFLVNASVNDSTGVNRVNMTLFNNTGNATGLIPMSLGAGTTLAGWWNVTFDSTTLRDGFYNLSVNATDSAGYINISQNITIRIDNTKPNATIITPRNNTNLSGNILINASINDSSSGAFNATFRLMNRTFATAWLYTTMGAGTIAVGWWNTTFNSFQLADGRYNITVNATDFSGNQQVLNISEINIDNGGPIVRNVSIPYGIYLVPGDVSFAVCNATVEDDNGPDYIYLVNATFYNSAYSFDSADDRNNHYTNSSCVLWGQPSSNRQNYTCGFDVYYYADNATWVCNVTATASATFNRTNSSVNLTLMNALLAIGVNESEVDYGNISVLSTSIEKTVNISNFGNIPINLSVRGFGWDNETWGNDLAMMCEASNISIGYERYSNVSGASWQNMINLTSTLTQLRNFTLWQKQDDYNIGNDTNTTYWRLRVPLGVYGLCNGTINFAGKLG